MDGPRLPRRGLSTGAIGHGAGGRRYRLLAPMERGGMGELFLARVSQAGQPDHHVVVKRLLADLIDDPKYVAMFKSEADVMHRLDHPNIVSVYDIPVIDRAQCLAMELVHGKSAQQILARTEDLGVRIPAIVALKVMSGILRGLEHAHNFRFDDGQPLNLVHRDVSPGNVLIAFDGGTKLTDFGIAKSQMSLVSTTVGIVKGKARYLAPEQILGEPASPRSDIFSAAAVTCELLTSEPTFDCSSVPKTLYAIVNGQRADLSSQLEVRAPKLVQLLDRALATNPSDRVQGAAELAAGFEAQVRVLAAEHGDVDVGAWLLRLFEGEEDVLRQFLAPTEPAPPPEPAPTPAHAELATEHSYQAASPVPVDRTSYKIADPAVTRAGQSGPHTEVIDRPRIPGKRPDLPDTDIQASAPTFRATYGSTDTESPEPPAPRTRTVVEAKLVDPAPDEDTGPARAPNRDDTQIVRRRTQPLQDRASVDEALSMVAFLQQQQASRRPPTSSLTTTEPSMPKPRAALQDEPLADVRPKVAGRIALLALGIALGVAGTLVGQAALQRSSPTPAAAAASPQASEPPPPVAPPRAVEAQAALAAEDPPPMPTPEPAATPEPPAPVEPATVDVLYPRGARVRLDGELLPGRVPLLGIEVAPGDHELRVARRRYRRKVDFEARAGDRFEMRKKLERLPANP